jgi:hypothetical protein
MDFIAVEAFITNLHPRAKRAHGGKLLDHKTNSLGRSGKSAISSGRRTPPLRFGMNSLAGLP